MMSGSEIENYNSLFTQVWLAQFYQTGHWLFRSVSSSQPISGAKWKLGWNRLQKLLTPNKVEARSSKARITLRRDGQKILINTFEKF